MDKRVDLHLAIVTTEQGSNRDPCINLLIGDQDD